MTHLVVGTAGHIDHGKSALVLALTGIDPDRLKEEKERGITIDLGFAHWDAGDVRVAFVDVPGHERFVKNMLAGVGGIDVVVLVVAADESVMPQTREHFDICRLLRVRSGIIVLTKCDLVDADMLELVQMDVADLVHGSFLDGAPVIPASSRTGAGLGEVRAALVAAATRLDARSAGGAARLPIDRVFTMKGFGTVATGTLVSGRLALDADVAALPGDREIKVRGLQVHGEARPSAVAGQRVAVNVAGPSSAGLARGDVLATPGSLTTTRVVDVRLDVLASVGALRHGARVRFHQGTTEVLGRVAVSRVIGDSPESSSAAAEIPGGRTAFARLRLERAAVLTRGDRFILRAYSPPSTIAGGTVLDPQPPRGGIRTAIGRERFERLDRAAGAEAVAEAFVGEGGADGLTAAALVARAGLSPDAAAHAVHALCGAGRARRVGDRVVAASVPAPRSWRSWASTIAPNPSTRACRAKKPENACAATPRPGCSIRSSTTWSPQVASSRATDWPWPGTASRSRPTKRRPASGWSGRTRPRRWRHRDWRTLPHRSASRRLSWRRWPRCSCARKSWFGWTGCTSMPRRWSD